ncbi:MAG: metal ABC transporter ATP-binding protein [Oscillospiraceae bacterium]
MAYLECRGVSLGYDGQTVLKGVNFKVEPQDYLCVLGENGSGKSTLIKGLLNLKSPLEGEIILADGLKPSEIGYLPQQTALQKDFPASVMEVVLSGRLNSLKTRAFYSRTDKEDARKKLGLMGIEGLRNKCYQELSGGQQQRVLLARALCATKKLLLLDEPVAGLDPVASAELYQLIKKLNSKYNLTVIMVSHDIKEAVSNASHILHLGRKQLFYGTAEQYMESKIGRSYLGGCSH